MSKDPQGSFKTHKNYLRAIASLAGLTSTIPEGQGAALMRLAGRVPKCSSYADTPPAVVDFKQVRSSLHNAWGTELLLALAARYASEDELVRLSNNWAVVQAYYVTYHATQALAVAKGHPRPESHPKTQRLFVSLWVSRPIDLAPWSIGCGNTGFGNCPSGRTIDDTIEAWTHVDTDSRWDLYGKALRTTREGPRPHPFVDAYEQARKQKRRAARRAWKEEAEIRIESGQKPRGKRPESLPRLTDAEKRAARDGVRTYSLIDYLYRLRIKTNYEDSDMFTDGPSDTASSRQVQKDIAFIATSTLFAHELHVRQLVGRTRFTDWVNTWLQTNMPPGLNLTLAGRKALL